MFAEFFLGEPMRWVVQQFGRRAETRLLNLMAMSLEGQVELPAVWGEWAFIFALLIDRYPCFDPLARANPLLASIVIQALSLRKEMPDLPTLFQAKRHEILAEIGFRPIKSHIKWLGRIRFDTLTGSGSIAAFRLLAQFPDRLPDLFRHKPCWYLTELETLASYPFLVEIPFLRQAHIRINTKSISDLKTHEDIRLSYLGDIERMMDVMDYDAGQKSHRWCQCTTISRMGKLHDRLVSAVNKKREREKEVLRSTPFPPPPLPGTEDIQPITSFGDLWDEGNQMHHCIGTYGDKVRHGKAYIYRILKPQRATLSLSKYTGYWTVGELQLACNKRPNEDTFNAVHEWLAACRKGLIDTVSNPTTSENAFRE